MGAIILAGRRYPLDGSSRCEVSLPPPSKVRLFEGLEEDNVAWEEYETGVDEVVEVAMTERAERDGVGIVGKTADVEESGRFVKLKLPTSQCGPTPHRGIGWNAPDGHSW